MDFLSTLAESRRRTKARRESNYELIGAITDSEAVGSAAVPSVAQRGASSVPGASQAPGKTGNASLDSFLKAIAGQESGGNYKARGVQTKSGQALGKYQILDTNFSGKGGWDKEALGRDITTSEYLGNPAIQEAIARNKLTQYYKSYGAEGAAKAWYAGPSNANTSSNSPQYGGPSINAYAHQVLGRMQ